MNKNILKSLIIRSNLIVNCRRTNSYQLFPEDRHSETSSSSHTSSAQILPSVNPRVAQLIHYSKQLMSFNTCGSLYLAQNPSTVDSFRRRISSSKLIFNSKTTQRPIEYLSAEDISKRYPNFFAVDDIRGGVFVSNDGLIEDISEQKNKLQELSEKNGIKFFDNLLLNKININNNLISNVELFDCNTNTIKRNGIFQSGRSKPAKSVKASKSSDKINTTAINSGLRKDSTAGGVQTMSDVPIRYLTLPNILSMTRIAFTPIIGYLVIDGRFSIALTLCAIGSVTDLLDGYIARKYDCVTRLGAILDPMADKLLVATLAITLTAVHLIPIWLMALILTRDTLIITGALYLMHKRLSPPKTLSRIIGMSTEMSQQFRPTLISKINTGFQLSLVAITLSAPVFGFTDHWLLTILQLATGATTLSSGLIYLKRLRPSLN